MMKNIKKLFDPNNIMNPGKIWDYTKGIELERSKRT